MIDEKKQVIKDLLFFKEKLYNGIFKDRIGVFDKAIELINQPKVGEWIPCSERLPEERVNPITKDYYAYPVTFNNDGVKDVRYYKFGKGHWYYGFQIMDDYVTAWMPLAEPYKESED